MGQQKIERMVLNMTEFASAMGISRKTAFKITKEPGFPMVRLGKRIVIPKEQLQQWMDRQANKEA